MKLFSKATEVLVAVVIVALTVALLTIVIVAGQRLESKSPAVVEVAHDTTTYNLALHGRHKVQEGMICINIDDKFNETAVLKVDNINNNLELITNGEVISYTTLSMTSSVDTKGSHNKRIDYHCNGGINVTIHIKGNPCKYNEDCIYIKSSKVFTSYYIQ